MLFLVVVIIQLVNGLKINNQFVEEPEDVETIIGSTVIFRCRTQPIDESQVTWCKNDFCTLGKTRDLPFYPRYEIIGHAHQGEHHFKILNVSLEDIGMYQCQIRAGPRRAGSMSRKAKLTVLQIPTSLSIDNPVVLVENVLSSIVCRATNAMPEAKLTWDLPKSINYLSKNDYVLLTDQSLRNSISNITFLPNRSYHGKLIQCQAHSSAIQRLNQTITTQQYIQTIFLPEINLSLIGEQTEDQLVSIDCHINSRPDLIKIEWFNGTNLLNVTNQNRLTLFLTRFMHKNNIICKATNQLGQTNKSITLIVNYKPIFVDNDGNQLNNYSVILVNEGESIKLECLIDSYPISFVSWIFKKKILSTNKTFIHIENVQSNEHLGLYICSGFNSLFGIFNRTIRVALKTPPEMIEQNKINSAYVGQSITLPCSISKDIPIRDIHWFREDQSKINSNENKYEISQNESDYLIEYKLLIKNILTTDEGYYMCTAINQYGSSITKFQLKVIHLKIYFLKCFIFYGSILIGIFLSFLLILCLLINSYKQNKKKRIRKKSSTTDETISSLAKQQEQIQHDYHDETNSTFDQCLIHEPFIQNNKNDFFDSSQDDLFYLKNNLTRHSTVV